MSKTNRGVKRLEDESKQSKLRTLIKEAPGWLQIIVSVGTMVFGLGVMYNTVNDVKARMDKVEGTNIELIKVTGHINQLDSQIQASTETQKQTNASVSKLADSVDNLGQSVANLQGKLSVMPPIPRHTKGDKQK